MLAVNSRRSRTIRTRMKVENRAITKNITETMIASTAEKFFCCWNRLVARRKLLNPKKLTIDMTASRTIAMGCVMKYSFRLDES